MDDDSLIGCRWKLQQAWRHLQTLDAEVDQFFARDETEPPMYLGVLVGDFLHNLRCTLDHLVWQLVLLNDQEPSERNQFPIFDTVERYRAKAPVYLAGVGPSPQTLIETFQPFHLDGDPRDHMLAVLRRLSNIDKHRFVHPVVVTDEGATREVRFTELEITTATLGWMNRYVTYTVFKPFERLFPPPSHMNRAAGRA